KKITIKKAIDFITESWDNINQPKSDILLENNEIKEIDTKLLDEKEILDDERIISMVQADENEESVSQEIEDKDEVPNLSVTAAKVFNAMQTVIRYKEQENLESNLSLKELVFLRNLFKEYKHVYEKSIFPRFVFPRPLFSRFVFPRFIFPRPYLQDSYSQDSYFQGSYFQDSYSQNLYSQESDLQESDLQKSDSQESDSQELCLQDLYFQDLYFFYSQNS
ncbi:2382_t:CDS:2, partial [Dentiscutata heterogama]